MLSSSFLTALQVHQDSGLKQHAMDDGFIQMHIPDNVIKDISVHFHAGKIQQGPGDSRLSSKLLKWNLHNLKAGSDFFGHLHSRQHKHCALCSRLSFFSSSSLLLLNVKEDKWERKKLNALSFRCWSSINHERPSARTVSSLVYAGLS